MKDDDGQPVVMLNGLRFRDDTSRQQYEAYLRHLIQAVRDLGGDLIFYGIGSTTLTTAEGYDAIMLMRYPSRRAFVQMLRDPQFQRITELRTYALCEALLQATREESQAPC